MPGRARSRPTSPASSPTRRRASLAAGVAAGERSQPATIAAPCHRHRSPHSNAAAWSSARPRRPTKLALLKPLARMRLASAARRAAAARGAVLRARLPRRRGGAGAGARRCWRALPSGADLRAFRAALADSGIAGTAIHFRFFAGQALVAGRSAGRATAAGPQRPRAEARIARALPPLLTPGEAQALAELKLPGYAALDRLRGKNESDAVFLLRRIAAMPGNGFTREACVRHRRCQLSCSRRASTRRRAARPISRARRWRFGASRRRAQRPDLRAELARAPRAVRRMSVQRGTAIVDLARAAMVTRERSLEAFSFADARDAWLVDDGDGLAFAFVGVMPPRRHAVAVELRQPDAAQRRADRLRAGRHRRPQRGAVVQHLRHLSRRRGGVHLRALAGRAAAPVRRHVVQHRALPARPGQRRSDRIGRLVVLRQARLRAARRRDAKAGARPSASACSAAPAAARRPPRCASWPSATCSSTSTPRGPSPCSHSARWACARRGTVGAGRRRTASGPSTRPAPS